MPSASSKRRSVATPTRTSFEQAMQIHERFKAPFFLARTLLHRASLHRERAATGDPERANELLTEALTIARAHGYTGLERTADLLRA